MPNRLPGVAYSVTIRAEYSNEPGMLGKIASAIGEVGGDIEAVDLVQSSRNIMVRDLTVNASNVAHGQEIVARVRQISGVRVANVSDPTFLLHLGGKLEVHSKTPLRTRNDLSMAYTPGVARVCMAIYDDPGSVWTLTVKGNTVAVVTDGTAVLGLGDIGPLASMPVMEGKAVLYDRFVGLSATPILVDTKDPEEFIQTVEKVAPSFGGIHLEDISSPECYHIEDELNRRLSQPVMHDDQHGTATVLLAAVLSALRETGHSDDSSLVCAQIGLGAAGFGIARLLLDYGFQVIGSDPQPDSQQRLINYGGTVVELAEAMQTADVVVATTGVVGLIKPAMIRPARGP